MRALLFLLIMGAHFASAQTRQQNDLLNLINEYRANPYVVLLNIDQQLSFTNDTTTAEFKELRKHMEDLIFFTIGADGLPPLVFIEPIISLKRNGHKRSLKEIDFITLYSFGESEYNILLNLLVNMELPPTFVQDIILGSNMISIGMLVVKKDNILLRFSFDN